ncbi:hypothetical protein [Echinicola rosea]|nr:hypothetical protein [Echinicola rosea]
MKQLETGKQKVINVINLFLLIVLMTACATSPLLMKNETKNDLEYEVIKLLSLSDNGLFYKTLKADHPSIYGMMDYNMINENNRKESVITEMDRYLDFDTIFNASQRMELDHKLKNLKNVHLDRKQLKISKLRYEHTGTGRLERITFPIFQQDSKGNLYAFLFYSWSTLKRMNGASYIYIFVKHNNKWEKLSTVFVSIT